METQDIKKVIEIEGVKLSPEAIAKIFYLQHCFHKEHKNIPLNFHNESVDFEILQINDSIHALIDIAKEDEKRNSEIMYVLWTLNDYKNLLDALKSPEQNI
jgi:hypothetical protein